MNYSTRPQTNTLRRALPPVARRARRLVVALLAGSALVLAACSNSGSTTPTTAAPSTPTTMAGSPGSPGGSSIPAGAHTITIKNFAFSPSTVTVAPGDRVTVTNDDQVAHTVTSAKGGFDTGDIAAGQSKTITAPNNPGDYPYICSIHQYMTGTLIVSG